MCAACSRNALDWLVSRQGARSADPSETLDTASLSPARATSRRSTVPPRSRSESELQPPAGGGRCSGCRAAAGVAPEPVGRLVQEAWSLGQRVDLEPAADPAIVGDRILVQSFCAELGRCPGLMQVMMTRVHDDKCRLRRQPCRLRSADQSARGRAGAEGTASPRPARSRAACATTSAPPTGQRRRPTPSRSWPSRNSCSPAAAAARCRPPRGCQCRQWWRRPGRRQQRCADDPGAAGVQPGGSPSAAATGTTPAAALGYWSGQPTPGASLRPSSCKLARPRNWRSRSASGRGGQLPGAWSPQAHRFAAVSPCVWAARSDLRKRAGTGPESRQDCRIMFTTRAIYPLCHRPRNQRRDRSRSVLLPGRAHRADRQRELFAGRRAGRAGQPAHQQVRRRLSGQARATTVAASMSTVEQLAIDRANSSSALDPQRAARLRLAGQPGGVLRPAAARRHHHGPEPGRRRPPDHGMPLNMSGKVVQVVSTA